MRGSRGGGGGVGSGPPAGKSQVAAGFLRCSGMNTHREEIGAFETNCFSKEKKIQRSQDPLMEFSGTARET